MSTTPDLGRELTTVAEQFLQGQRAPGVAVAVTAGGEVVYELGLGYRDAESGLPVTADTVFGIASVAKPFTALAVLQLTERGALSVADPVRKWLPEFRLPRGHPGSADVALHHLLTHTSGLPPEVALPCARARDMLDDPDLGWLGLSERQLDRLRLMEQRGELVDSYEGLIERIGRADAAVVGPPGRHFSYSGEGYALLAAVVERASGQRFPEYVHERILNPLRMSGTGFRPGTFEAVARTHPVAQLYVAAPSGGAPTSTASPAWWASGRIHGHANMVSTARDLLRFAAVLCGGEVRGRRIAGIETIRRMLVPHAPIPTGGFYGYGLFIHPNRGGASLAEHAGGGKGVGAQLVLAPSRGIGAVALTNAASVPRSPALTGVNVLLKLPPDLPLQTFPEHRTDPERLARLVGTYRWNDTEDGMRFEIEDGTLRLCLPGQSLPCRPFADDGVVVCGPEFPVRFLLDRDGAAWALSDGARISRRST